MKNFVLITNFVFILFCFQSTEAQIFKKLKDKIESKIERKVEQKIDQEVDKTVDNTIDGIFEGSDNSPQISEKSDKSNFSDSENKTYSGTVSFDHVQNYGTLNINTLDKLKIERTNEGYTFSGNWWSHVADIYDGFYLKIETDENLELGKTYTFDLSSNGSFSLGYDPEMTYLKNQKSKSTYGSAVSDEYQAYDLKSGSVNVTINKDKSFEIDFSGESDEFTKKTRDANNEVSESFYTSSVSGKIQGQNPKFIDNKSITKQSNTESSTASTVSTPTNSSNSSAQAKDAYVFTFETVVEMTVPDQDRKSKLSYLLNPNANYIGMKADMSEYSGGDMGGESVIVMDGDQTFIFVDTPGMKMQMSSGQMGNQQQQMPSDQMENYDYTNLNKTGNTKTILGYTCYEYVMSDDQNTIQMWVAPELVVPNWFMQNQDVIQGHMLEYSVDSTDGQITMTTLEIKDNINKTINPSEYRKMF